MVRQTAAKKRERKTHANSAIRAGAFEEPQRESTLHRRSHLELGGENGAELRRGTRVGGRESVRAEQQVPDEEQAAAVFHHRSESDVG